MDSRISRRDVLRFVGGSALGLLLSPLPWKALDDSAIWTQNWPWIPEPTRGDLRSVHSACMLCPAGCGMRARCVGSQPVSLHGIPGHPLSGGALCPMGLLAHHLPFHPARIKKPMRFAAGENRTNGTVLSIEEMQKELGAIFALNAGENKNAEIAILDSRPGRAASAELQSLAEAFRHAILIRDIDERERTLRAISSRFASSDNSLAIDFSKARTVLSFGAPLIDGWGTPARASQILDRQQTPSGRSPLHLIQIESAPSRTAQFANEWLAPRPGTDALVALALVRIMIDEGMAPARVRPQVRDWDAFRKWLLPFTVDAVADRAGLSAESLRTTARRFVSERPSVAVADRQPDMDGASADLHFAVACLNLVAGAHLPGGPIRAQQPRGFRTPDRPATHAGQGIESVPDHSLRVLIIDESLSGSVTDDAILRRKFIDESKAIIVSLSPFVTPRSFCTQYVVPAAAFGEFLTDVPGVSDAGAETLTIASPFQPAPEGMMSTASFCSFLRRAAGAPVKTERSEEERIQARIEAITSSARGTIFRAETRAAVAANTIASADELKSILASGGCWIDVPPADVAQHSIHLLPPDPESAAIAARLRERLSAVNAGEAHELPLVRVADPMFRGAAAVSPLISKLHEESGLRTYAHQAFVHPATASAHGLDDRSNAVMESGAARMPVSIRFDESVAPNIVVAAYPHGTSASSASVKLQKA